MKRSIFHPALILALAGPAAAVELYTLTEPDLARLAAGAPAALREPIKTVMDKPPSPPGSDMHNYVSYARYYWPDPAKSGGLPFIGRDGQHNREQVARGDRGRIGDFCDVVPQFAAAWHLHRDETAARRAGEWLRAWFVAPATRMNPHLEYAQVRLGHRENRGNPAGVLDARGLAQVADALRLLEGSPALSPADTTAVRAWFDSYLDWLVTAPNAVAERRAKNNHGSWYFAQVIPLARYRGRNGLARKLCEEARALIAAQIRPDGSQPDEIRRVDGLGYSRFNLEAHFTTVRAARGLGLDLWNYTAPNGASLRAALDYLKPFNADPAKWPASQHEKLAPGFLDHLLRQAAGFDASGSVR